VATECPDVELVWQTDGRPMSGDIGLVCPVCVWSCCVAHTRLGHTRLEHRCALLDIYALFSNIVRACLYWQASCLATDLRPALKSPGASIVTQAAIGAGLP